MRALRLVPALFLVPLALASAPLQDRTSDSKRANVSGRVLRTSGNGWQGAVVTLVATRYTPAGAIELDRATARAGERGEFTARVLPDLSYAAWAVTQERNASVRGTDVAEPVFAGSDVILRERTGAFGRVRFRIKGLEAWKEHAPLRCTVRAEIVNTVPVAVDLSPDGSGTVIGMPGKAAAVELFTKEGTPLLGMFEHTPVNVSLHSREVQVIDLPPPVRYRFRVTDKATGKPVDGARILSFMYTGHKLGAVAKAVLGSTRAGGRVSVELPVDQHPATRVPLWLYVEADDLATVEIDIAKAGESRSLEISLPRASRVTGKLRASPGSKTPVELVLFSRALESGGGLRALYPRMLAASRSGELSFNVLPREPYLLLARCAKRDVPVRSPHDDTVPVSPFVVLAAGTADSGKPTDLGELHLSHVGILDVHVESGDGSIPAMSSVYLANLEYLSPEDHKGFYPAVFELGRRGRMRIPFLGKSNFVVAATSEGTVGASFPGFTAPSKDTAEIHPVSVTLSQTCRISGTIVDENDQPVPHAQVSLTVEAYAPRSLQRRCNVFFHFEPSNMPVSGKDGRFVLSVPRGIRCVVHARDGVRSGQVLVLPKRTAGASLDLTVHVRASR